MISAGVGVSLNLQDVPAVFPPPLDLGLGIPSGATHQSNVFSLLRRHVTAALFFDHVWGLYAKCKEKRSSPSPRLLESDDESHDRICTRTSRDEASDALLLVDLASVAADVPRRHASDAKRPVAAVRQNSDPGIVQQHLIVSSHHSVALAPDPMYLQR